MFYDIVDLVTLCKIRLNYCGYKTNAYCYIVHFVPTRGYDGD